MNIRKLHILSLLTVGALALPVHAFAQSATADKSPPKPGVPSPAAMATTGEKEAKDRAQGFKGKIGSVDPTKKTLTLESKKEGGGRTLTVTNASKLTKGADETATWDDLTVGQEVRGSYKKSADGTLEIVKLSVGPKANGAEKPKPEQKTKTEKMDQ